MMERTRSSRSTAAASAASTRRTAANAAIKQVNEKNKKSPARKPATPGRSRGAEKRRLAPDSDDEEFFGFSNSDIPQPIVIKTEPVEEGSDECIIVEVSKAAKPLAMSPSKIKKEKLEDDDDMDTFHGFSLDDLPQPIVIKEEPLDNTVSAERVNNVQESPNKPAAEVLDDLPNELSESPKSPVKTEDEEIKKIIKSPSTKTVPETPVSVVSSEPISPAKLVTSPSASTTATTTAAAATSPKYVVVPRDQDNNRAAVPGPKFVVKQGVGKNDPKPMTTPEQEQVKTLPSKIQIINQDGQKIEILTQESEGDFDTDEADEDQEFTTTTVIVEDNGEEVTNITNGDIHIDSNNVIQGESIEDIIAQFENSETGASKSVSCPNCKKCFVNSQYLNLHISNSATMCELCNTQVTLSSDWLTQYYPNL